MGWTIGVNTKPSIHVGRLGRDKRPGLYGIVANKYVCSYTKFGSFSSDESAEKFVELLSAIFSLKDKTDD